MKNETKLEHNGMVTVVTGVIGDIGGQISIILLIWETLQCSSVQLLVTRIASNVEMFILWTKYSVT